MMILEGAEHARLAIHVKTSPSCESTLADTMHSFGNAVYTTFICSGPIMSLFKHTHSNGLLVIGGPTPSLFLMSNIMPKYRRGGEEFIRLTHILNNKTEATPHKITDVS